ncbi:MAG: CARDB domain-containing protein [Myxococcota bacterium]
MTDGGVDARADGEVGDADVSDAGDTADSSIDVNESALPNLSVACADPEDVVGVDDRIEIMATVGSLGAETATPFDIELQMFSAAESMWVEIGSTRVVRLLADETQSIQIVGRAPSFVERGTNQLRCVVDPEGVVEESSESDNTNELSVFATGAPDLALERIVAPGSMNCSSRVTVDVSNLGVVASSPVRLEFIQDLTESGGGGGFVDGVDIPAIAAGGTFTGVRDDWQGLGGGRGKLVGRVEEPFDANSGNDSSERTGIDFEECGLFAR